MHPPLTSFDIRNSHSHLGHAHTTHEAPKDYTPMYACRGSSRRGNMGSCDALLAMFEAATASAVVVVSGVYTGVAVMTDMS